MYKFCTNDVDGLRKPSDFTHNKIAFKTWIFCVLYCNYKKNENTSYISREKNHLFVISISIVKFSCCKWIGDYIHFKDVLRNEIVVYSSKDNLLKKINSFYAHHDHEWYWNVYKYI